MTRFKNVPWFKWYKVSILWDVMSFKNNRHWLRKEWILMKKKDDTNWYLVATLRNPWEKAKSYKIHKIVMDTFVWPANWLDVNHKNWNRYDNRLSNLEYCTRSYNLLHSYNKLWRVWPNKWKFGKDSTTWKIVLQFSKEWTYITEFWSTHEAQRLLWIWQQNIWKVCNWKRNTAWWYIWKYKH